MPERMLEALLVLVAAACCVHAAQAQCAAGASVPSLNVPALVPTITTSPLVDLRWLDKNDQKVIAFTKKAKVQAGGLWQSGDGAKTWTDKTSMLQSLISPFNETVEVLDMWVQKANPNNIAVLGAGACMWHSKDYGETYTTSHNPTGWRGSSILQTKVHPWHDDWLLVLVKRPGCTSVDMVMTKCPFDLMLTQNLFAGPDIVWKNLTQSSAGKIAGFVDFEWGAALCPDGVAEKCEPFHVTDHTIFATVYDKLGEYDQAWDKDVHFVLSGDLFVTSFNKVYCGNMFEVIGNSIYLAYANECPTDINGGPRRDIKESFNGIILYTSTDGGRTFAQACLPVAIKQEGYELMPTHDNTGALIVVDFLHRRDRKDQVVSNIYSAGPHHAIFTLSLPNVYRSDFGFSSDLMRVATFPGIWIANTLVSLDGQPFEVDDSSPAIVETRITLNGGGSWHKIRAPSSFSSQACNRCVPGQECYLHLRGMSTWDSMGYSFPSVYSTPYAPGLVMATGVTASPGTGLEDDLEGTCTWVSNDSGLTWKDVAVGSWIYEFADWGSTVVMAKHYGLRGDVATEVRFSVDMGNCWQSVNLSTALYVDNIRIEPDGQRPRVVVHGRACEKSTDPLCSIDGTRPASVPGIMYVVDVQELLAGKLALCSQSDLEDFHISNPFLSPPSSCILGKSRHLLRRRQSAMCLYGPDYKIMPAINDSCTCSREDVECDYGYVEDANDKSCVLLPPRLLPSCPIVEQEQYFVSLTGLRLVHADTCENLTPWIADTDGMGKCLHLWCARGPVARRGWSWWFRIFMFLLFSGICFGAFVAWWIYMATEPQRDKLRSTYYTATDLVVDAYNSLRNRIFGPPRGSYVDPHDDLAYFQPLGEVPTHEPAVFTLQSPR